MKKTRNLLLLMGILALAAVSTSCGESGKASSGTTAAAAASDQGGSKAQGKTEAAGEEKSSEVKSMSGADLQALEDDKDKKETALVIDVRSPEEYAEGHVKFAVNMPLDTLKDRLGELESWKDKTLILYCNSGKKSGEAAKLLSENGFKDLRNADGVKQYDYKLVKYGNITGEELMKKKDEADLIVDVREAKDYETDHFDKAVNVSVDKLSDLDSLLPENKDALILTHCYSGNRSQKAAEYIADKGYTNVWNTLDGTKEMEYSFH